VSAATNLSLAMRGGMMPVGVAVAKCIKYKIKMDVKLQKKRISQQFDDKMRCEAGIN